MARKPTSPIRRDQFCFRRRQIDPSTFSDVRPWVVRAVAQEDEKPDERLWKKAPTSQEAEDARLKRVKFLIKHASKDPNVLNLVDRLEQCENQNRCLSGACPECGRLIQRWFVRQSKRVITRHLDPAAELISLTIVPSTPIVSPGS